MANYMKEVTKLLGVELEEVFFIKEHPSYSKMYLKFTENGLEQSLDKDSWTKATNWIGKGLITGALKINKLPWKPKEGDRYYFPCPASIEKWDYSTWSEREVDYYRLNHGFVCKTMERAVAISQEMLKDIRVIEE